MINDYEATKPIVPQSDATYSDGNSDVISTLNELIETCKDGELGFKAAAEGVERPDLKSLFEGYSHQRAQFAGVLQGLVKGLGGDPESSGSVSGAMHRGWIDIKSVFTGKDEEAILNECERGEDVAKEAYEKAAKQDLPPNVANILNQQSQAVLAAHNRIRSLRNSEQYRTASPKN